MRPTSGQPIGWRKVLVAWVTLLGAAGTAPGQDACRVAKVSASDPVPFQSLGYAVSVSGATALAGTLSGAAYVFGFDGTTWVQTQKLLPSDGPIASSFGDAVSIDGTRVMIGALSDDDGAMNAGAVYYFRLEGATWIEAQKLHASDPGPDHAFGKSVAVSGDVAVIGAIGDPGNGGSGSVYVFRLDAQSSKWIQEQKLLPSDGVNGDLFGISVAIDGDVAVVGAEGQDLMCPGGFASNAGAAYVFRFSPETLQWNEEQMLVAADCSSTDRFGGSVSVSDDVVLVGARHNNAAYLFHYDAGLGQWVQQQKLVASDGLPGDQFGRSVAIEGQTALIGAWENDEVGPDHGAAYVFRLQEGSWVEQQRLLPDPGPWTAFFGWSVGLSGDAAVVGAYGEDSHGVAYLYAGLFPVDCNGNGSSDSCDIFQGVSVDADGDGVPDECPPPCPWDLDGDGVVGIVDFLDLLSLWGTNPGGPPDFNGDGDVTVTDFLALLANWGPCS